MGNEAKRKKVSLIFLLLPPPRKFRWAGFFLLLLLLGAASCNTTEPPDPPITPQPKATLTLQDVSCLEAWIKLELENIQLPVDVNVFQDSITILEINNLTSNDTIIYIDSLQPNQTYKFHSVIQAFNQSSNEIVVNTLDTTSHDFTWETWTFGEHSSSVLYDVAIVNENCIWAVGEIYMNDSIGNYNAAYWDGVKWQLKLILYKGGFWPIRTIYAFSENDIWFSAFVRYDGQNFVELSIPQILIGWSINKLWGSSSNDLYAVGDGGNIAHWNGSNWTKIESGTDVNLRDISGQGDEIFISGYSTDLSRSILLKLKNNTVETIWENNTISGTPPYGNLLYSIAGNANNLFVSSNLGVFKHKLKINHPPQKLFTVPRRVYKIAGSNINDIFTAGDRSNIWHYNGVSKKELYVNLSVPAPFYSAATKANIIVAVGTTVENVIYHKATILIGKR